MVWIDVKLSKQPYPCERDLLPDAMLFGALAYVLAPWEDRVYTGNWRRARTVIDERGKIAALIGA